jgi:hypothetical protein
MPRTHVTPVTPRPPLPKRPRKGPSFNNLPQSKRALREPLPIEPLATVPTQGGGGGALCSSRRTMVGEPGRRER